MAVACKKMMTGDRNQISAAQAELSAVALVGPYAEIPDIASGAVSKGGLGSAPCFGNAVIVAMVTGLDCSERNLTRFTEKRVPNKICKSIVYIELLNNELRSWRRLLCLIIGA